MLKIQDRLDSLSKLAFYKVSTFYVYDFENLCYNTTHNTTIIQLKMYEV